jgi:protein-disulfide isomerase
MPKTTKRSITKKSAPVRNVDENTATERPVYPRPSMPSSSLVVTVLVAILAFSTGYLVSQVRTLSGKSGTTTTTQATQQTAGTTQADVKVSEDQVNKVFDSQKLVFGDKNSKLKFVEFSDPSCPYCQIAGGKNPELAQQANFQYKDQGGTYDPPLTEIKNLVDQGKAAFAMVYFPGHGNGEIGQQALYCANDQGKFWEAQDTLMTNDGYNLLNNDVKNDKANDQKIVDFLANVVDPTALKNCLDSEKYKSQLTKDISLAQAFGVQGTPHFLVNTTAYNGAYSFTDMQATVNSALGQ